MNGCEEEVFGQEVAEQLPLRQDQQDVLETCITTNHRPKDSLIPESSLICANHHLKNGTGGENDCKETRNSNEGDENPRPETETETPDQSRDQNGSEGWCETETARAIMREESIPQLFVSIQTGSVREVTSLLEQQPCIVNSPRYGGLAPIHYACHKQNIRILRVLLDHGAKIGSMDTLGNTPLHLAVNDTWIDGVSELLKRGASPNAKNAPPSTIKEVVVETPLHAAIRRRDTASVTLMMEHEPDLSILDGNNCSVLHLAAQTRNLELVRKLVNQPTAVKECNNKDKNGRTVLLAVLSEKCDEDSELLVIELIKILSRSVVDINATNYVGETPLFLASRYGLSRVVELLLSLGSDPTILTTWKQSVLHAACLSGSSDTLDILLQRDDLKNMVTVVDNDKCRAFDYAVRSWSVHCCYLLLINGEHLANIKDGVSNCELMLEHLPSASQVLKKLFNSHVHMSEESLHDPDFSITFDYSALLSEEKGTIQCSVVSELVHSPSEDLIKHPLLESFLYVKWCCIQKYFYTGVLMYFIFLILHTSYVMLTFGNSPIDWNKHIAMLWTFRAGHILFYIILLFPNVIMVIANFRKYSKQVETLIRLVTFISSAVVVFSPTIDYKALEEIAISKNMVSPNDPSAYLPMTTERQMAAVSVFFVWVELMMLLGRYPMLGTYILMFSGVAKSMMKFLFSFVFLLFGFSFSFHILFQKLSVFKTFPLSFVKTLMMMSGEIAFSEFVLAMDVPLSGLVFLSLYLFIVAILLANLFIGLAVNDIPSLQKRGRIHRLAKEASYIVAFEKLLLVLKSRTSFPRPLLQLVARRCRIKPKVKVFPNKKETIVTRENIREAINLRNLDVPKEETYTFDDHSVSSLCLKSGQKQYAEEITALKSRIDELVKCCNRTQQQLSLMHQLLDTHMGQMSLQLQQHQRTMQEIYDRSF
ncbi:transient receptor potential channel pyrexia-like [Penaeus chinensis]|uniref:transient receptor potential channel pyrexia-like n=1 Tax=Penaeus chinensis TaxID=139456 RepID=UPI001FB8374C|nr:transient receptor potential channel pyrexia-like [Penaeus chinensis]